MTVFHANVNCSFVNCYYKNDDNGVLYFAGIPFDVSQIASKKKVEHPIGAEWYVS